MEISISISRDLLLSLKLHLLHLAHDLQDAVRGMAHVRRARSRPQRLGSRALRTRGGGFSPGGSPPTPRGDGSGRGGASRAPLFGLRHEESGGGGHRLDVVDLHPLDALEAVALALEHNALFAKQRVDQPKIGLVRVLARCGEIVQAEELGIGQLGGGVE